MNPFKGRHFQRDIILWAVRWYCKYGISYRELQEMLAERGVNVDHSTIYRWVQRYAPEMEKRLRWYWRNPSDLCPWHMDETYVKVNGRWAYLYRAVDSRGRTVDFYLSSRRNSKAAYRFLGKILNNVKKWQIPRFINTDKAPAYGRGAVLRVSGRTRPVTGDTPPYDQRPAELHNPRITQATYMSIWESAHLARRGCVRQPGEL